MKIVKKTLALILLIAIFILSAGALSYIVVDNFLIGAILISQLIAIFILCIGVIALIGLVIWLFDYIFEQ